MSRQSRSLLLAVLFLAFAPLASLAQTPPIQAPLTGPGGMKNEIIHFASDYTKVVVAGVTIGGLLMNLAVGGSGATLAGAIAGSSLAGMLFLEYQAQIYIVQRAAP